LADFKKIPELQALWFVLLLPQMEEEVMKNLNITTVPSCDTNPTPDAIPDAATSQLVRDQRSYVK